MTHSTYNKPVQPLSIQWIDLKRAKITEQHPNQSSLSKAIECIINTHNEQKKDQNSGYQLDSKPDTFTSGGYSFKHYSYRKIITPIIATQSQEHPKKTKTSSFLVFLYQHQPSARIIALTTRNAWSVVRPYIDYSFPIKVAERVCNPKKIIQVARRCLFKVNAQETLLYPYEYELYKTSNLYYLVESFTCEIKNNSTLFSTINSIKSDGSVKKLNRCWIKVTTGGLLRIGTRLSIEDYPAILDLFAKYMTGPPPTR